MEQSSAMWAQRMVLRLQPEAIIVEDDNEMAVEQFPLKLITDPTAYTSNDPKDVYNNLLVFVVEQEKGTLSRIPAEMHIFQCCDVSNTLNQCFDDIERFVARIQSAYAAHRELEMIKRQRGKLSGKTQGEGILQMRARLPSQTEFVAILHMFKFCMNLLGKLQDHIHDPTAPELVHILFDPLTVILDACHWALNRNIGYMVVDPSLTPETKALLNGCLNSRERDVWNSLGNPWNLNGYVSQELSRVSLEKERLDFEKEKIAEKQKMIEIEAQKIEVSNVKTSFLLSCLDINIETYFCSYSPGERRTRAPPPVDNSDLAESRQSAFFEELRSGDAMIARVEYDRIGQNAQEMSVTKGEYLEVMNSSKNWWQCRNAYNQVGYVPKTFLTVVEGRGPEYVPPSHSRDYRRPNVADEMHTVAKERIGKYGGYRYF
ncbi:unnamed protein product [Soboliphyme baturini]|uniref:SH3 domain-containing protein n=1 Tax=Soboliphyme baturini TaxID=241478 RepID=A0A183IIW1_9BILA|nr:unnamed protein product [Soboliphyme baturini]